MGYPHGLAEELARAVVWLTVGNVDGLGALLATGPVASIHPDIAAGASHGGLQVGGLQVGGFQVGLQGPGMLDLLIAEPDAGLELAELDSTWLFVGLCGVASQRHGVTIELRSGSSALRVGADTPDLASGSARALVDNADGPLHVTCRPIDSALSGDGPAAPGSQVARLSVDDERWRAAEELAAKTYVPTSEHSRHHGAGAGVTDND
jgi:hypothetical protein